METINLLRSGQLAGSKRLKLACSLTQFPSEIFALADSLEILDLSNNHLRALPDEFERLKHLKIVFFTNNDFEEIPEVLSQCPHLKMVSFKSNQIASVGERTLPPSIRWLILTNNKIETLPASFGSMSHLQKLMLAGNRLSSLPEEMAECKNLELIRLSANQLAALPSWLFTLPRLSWLAYAGNPLCRADATHQPVLPDIDWDELTLGEILGQGASGVIYQGLWTTELAQKEVAIKIFKGEVTSDGLPADEMAASLAAGCHDHLVNVLGKLSNEPEQKQGLVFSFIPPDYRNLGQPPDFDTCTRDTYSANASFSLPVILRLTIGIALAAAHLHAEGIMHGDLYAHNILVDETGHSLLGDFGAASFYDPSNVVIGQALERLEVRAFGCLLEDMLDRCTLQEESEYDKAVESLRCLQQDCLNQVLSQRPLFTEIGERLTSVERQVYGKAK
ncbi:leucine-rich repeat-containing protein kinase family protein [Allocoleopsis franciscana]|uniref:Leucine Rich Repeat (LRR)-containing protein,protein kinase family protein n=1 Tax=Allocoleopsis franciscana PCC 7113 TaxID=1173027 RepID=K9WPB5_9CYAN|nr:leucine-rich repeat-containing protein kinase family protein [Allocoleopsis franciscana]AFZ21641.1 Leucine Rich Repeat (LRR)-containing protein,protein kinase family protein [Allocoleopsis franciscana PCC 7113]